MSEQIPKVFKEIIKNDKQREGLRDEMTQSGWRKLRDLVEDRKMLRMSAEESLKWNRDKGANA